jgi:Ca2+-binding RTX toxin-like protein
VLDLDGDGTESTAVSAGISFDHDADGFAEATGWAGADDGLLVWDRDADGRIGSGRELFGTETLLQNGQYAANGFAALAEWDANADGKIDASDALWANLKVWVDADGDGFSAADELLTLSGAGVASINLGYTSGSGVDAAGNEVWLTGSLTRTDASIGQVTDYRFARDMTLTIPEEWLELPAAIATLPDVTGFGTVYDLRQAMVRDTSGALQQLVEDFIAETDPAGRNALLDQIVLKWTGAEGVDPASRGANIDARHLVALEAFMGRGFIGVGGSPNPNANATAPLESAYTSLTESVYAQLVAQTHLGYLYDQVVYSWDAQAQSLVGDVSQIVSVLGSNITNGDGAQLLDAAEFVRSVRGFGAELTLNLAAFHAVPALSFLLTNSYASISGTEIDDTIAGVAGGNVIAGLAGNDAITGSDASDLIHAGSGNDTIQSGNGNDVVYAGAGDDTVSDAAGWDTIYGEDGNDTINAASQYYGQYTIYGGAGNDVITMGGGGWYQMDTLTQTYTGGPGNDTITGGRGTDVYRYDRGDGADTITDYAMPSVNDKVVFGAGIAVGDVSARRVGYDMELRIADPGNPAADDRFTIKNWYVNSNYKVERAEFAGGAVLTAAQLEAQAAIITGTEGNDNIVGFDGSETYYGLGGNDTIQSGNGNDVVYGGAGDDTLNDAAGWGGDILYGEDGNDAITAASQYYGAYTIYGGAGNDTITMGGNGWYQMDTLTQTYTGGPGNDTITGGRGYNIYRFDRGDGVDTITDYALQTADDKIVFGTGIAVGDVSARRVGYDMELRIADPGNPAANDRITIKNWFINSYYRVERAEFAGGGVLTAAQLEAQAAIITGTESNDNIVGFDGSETYYGLGGNDTIQSGNGNDVVYAGAGDDTVSDAAGWGGDILYGEDGNDTINAASQYYGQYTIYGGAGNDVITMGGSGWYQMDTLTQTYTGGPGDDTITGGRGYNVYRYDRGDGADTITDYALQVADDKVVFGAGIAVGDVSARRVGYDMELRVADPGNPAADDRITIKNWYSNSYYKIERFEFADGTVVLASNILVGDSGANSISAGSGSSIMYGDAGNDTLTGGAANDSMHAGLGDDTLFGGAGNDALYGNEGNDTVSGEDGNDLLFGDAGADNISGGGGNDYLAGGSENDVAEGGNGDDVLQGQEGDDVVQGGGGNDLLTGDAGSDTLDGGEGNDLLSGGAGNDTIYTGGGSNIVAYNAGGGIDTVYAAAGATDTLSFGGGIGYDDLSLSKDGNDLVVSAGQDDRVVLKDWYAGANNVLNLQIVLDATQEYDANSLDPLYNRKVQTFDFLGMVSEFDAALAQSPGLTSWAVTNALLEFHLSGADDAALGGDLAYWYGKNGGFSGIGLQSAQQVLSASNFGAEAQSLRPFSGLQEGLVKLT